MSNKRNSFQRRATACGLTACARTNEIRCYSIIQFSPNLTNQSTLTIELSFLHCCVYVLSNATCAQPISSVISIVPDKSWNLWGNHESTSAGKTACLVRISESKARHNSRYSAWFKQTESGTEKRERKFVRHYLNKKQAEPPKTKRRSTKRPSVTITALLSASNIRQFTSVNLIFNALYLSCESERPYVVYGLFCAISHMVIFNNFNCSRPCSKYKYCSSFVSHLN